MTRFTASRYRLVAIDLDGTLLVGAQAMSQASAAALREAVAAGMLVAPATARPYRAAVTPFLTSGLEVGAISSGGADVRAPDGRRIVHATIRPEAGQFLGEMCDRAGWKATAATGAMVYRRDRVLPGWAPNAPPHLQPVTSFAGVDLTRVLAFGIYAAADDPFLRDLEECGDALSIHTALTHDGNDLVTITAAGVDKGTGLLALCEAVGVSPRNVIAFGDSDVDLPMFAVAGLAVAMADAPGAVRRQAHRIAPSVRDDGVAAVLRDLL